MTEPLAVADACEHHYETRLLGGHPITVRACILCRTPDWKDLMEQAVDLYRWGWQEGRTGGAVRATLSAYDRPADGGQPAGLTPCTCRQAVHAREHRRPAVPGCPWCAAQPEPVVSVHGARDLTPEARDALEALITVATQQINQPPTAHDTGPTVAEAKADDRAWFGAEKGGE